MGAEAAADVAANRRASVLLKASELPEGLDSALRNLTHTLAPLVPEAYRAILTPEQLVAAQPNLHNGKAYLPSHLDEPCVACGMGGAAAPARARPAHPDAGPPARRLHDGFGIVIVTVAIGGSARILITESPWDARERREHWFPLRPGQAYALSSDARNVCLHGVLADDGCDRRESLNLRALAAEPDPASCRVARPARLRPSSTGPFDCGRPRLGTGFGLHAAERGVPFSAYDEIECHWPATATPATTIQSPGTIGS